MQVPPDIAYHGLTQSADLDELIRRKVAHLERLNHRLIGCRVTLEKPHRHKRKGCEFRVQVGLTMPPSRELVVAEEDDVDLPQVVHRAFEKAERRLQKIAQELRGEEKRHPAAETNAYVTKLFRTHGFLRTLDDRQVYFHKNSVREPGFSALSVGASVHFCEEAGEKGPQASTVHIVSEPTRESF